MQWQDLNDPENGMKEVIIIMFVEWLVTLFLAYYADRALFSGSCMRKPSTSARKPSAQRNGTQVPSRRENPDVAEEVCLFAPSMCLCITITLSWNRLCLG